MKGLNKVLLVGILGSNPEVRFTQNGKAICNFSIATIETYKDKDGNAKSFTEWHDIIACGKVAEICGEYLFKGSKVFIEGSLRTNSWTRNKKSKKVVLAQSMQVISQPGKNSDTKDSSDDYINLEDQELPF